jgi:hypothetical protein
MGQLTMGVQSTAIRASMVAMPPDANPVDDPADVAALAGYARALVEAVDAALPGWVERVVDERWRAWRGKGPPDDLVADAHEAGEQARAEVLPGLRALLSTDAEAQWTSPLSLIRRAVSFPAGVLARAGVPAVVRDADAERLFPDDVYDLSPAAFADLDPSVHEPGLVWGAAKAHVILRRRKG